MSKEYIKYLAASLPDVIDEIHKLNYELEMEEISPPYDDVKGKGCKRILDIRECTTEHKLTIKWCYEQYD